MTSLIANHLCSVSNYATSLFKDKILPILSNLDRRIILIVTAVLGCWTCYTRFVKRRVISSDGTIRDGIVFWGKLEGIGKKVLPNEEIFLDGKIGKIKTIIGKFEKDELHKGPVILKSSDETTYEGYFKQGQLIGDITAYYPSGMMKHGRFENGKLREGRIIFPNGESIVNIFQDVELD